MKTNKFISAVILITFLLLTAGSAGAELLRVGFVFELAGAFFPIDIVDLIYDDAQDLIWADCTTFRNNWSNASNLAEGIDGIYIWDEDPLEFSDGWRLPTVDEFLHLWSEEENNISEGFGSLYEVNYWTASQPDSESAYLFSMQSGELQVAFTSESVGYAIAVRDVGQNSQVPEPSSLVLLALGFLGLSGVIRSRKISGRA